MLAACDKQIGIIKEQQLMNKHIYVSSCSSYSRGVGGGVGGSGEGGGGGGGLTVCECARMQFESAC